MAQDDKARDLFIAGLRDAHAMETQALSIMRPQVARIEQYPEVKQKLAQHISETEDQIERLENILESLDEKKSTLKDTALSMAGGMAAFGHTVAPDEILKNSMANFAFENFEIAAYKSLITVAESGGFGDTVDELRVSLEEELAMAEWLDTNIAEITQKYLSLRLAGEHAKK